MRLELGQGTWVLGATIGGGGFGRVVEAQSENVDTAVAKLVPKEPGAQREMLFADLSNVRNVVPIIDSGETDTHWVLVMPRADKSLREHLDEVGAPLDLAASVQILKDMAAALADLDGRVVHRDIKPENVLYLEGHWCLADFGISRYAEATTAPDTRKHALTPAYAAPERWRYEHATAATDVYALGIVAYELLSGALPFRGPAHHDFREQHLTAQPAQLASVPAWMGALVEECLYKAPAARPGPANLLSRLERFTAQQPSPGIAALQQANREEVVRRGESARLQSEAQSESERRSNLFDAAQNGWNRIAEALHDAVTTAAPAATVQPRHDGGWTIHLGDASLTLAGPVHTRHSPWGDWTTPAMDVIAHSAIGVQMPPTRSGYEGRAHSLWYCDAHEEGRYQWFETAFMVSALVGSRGRQNPFALDPCKDSAKALWTGVAEWQVAWPFTPVDIGNLEPFINRWAEWFAAAAQGNLNHPSRMPEHNPSGSWRTR